MLCPLVQPPWLGLGLGLDWMGTEGALYPHVALQAWSSQLLATLHLTLALVLPGLQA